MAPNLCKYELIYTFRSIIWYLYQFTIISVLDSNKANYTTYSPQASTFWPAHWALYNYVHLSPHLLLFSPEQSATIHVLLPPGKNDCWAGSILLLLRTGGGGEKERERERIKQPCYRKYCQYFSPFMNIHRIMYKIFILIICSWSTLPPETKTEWRGPGKSNILDCCNFGSQEITAGFVVHKYSHFICRFATLQFANPQDAALLPTVSHNVALPYLQAECFSCLLNISEEMFRGLYASHGHHFERSLLFRNVFDSFWSTFGHQKASSSGGNSP